MLPDENPMAVARHWERRNLFRIRVITLAAVLALLWNLPLLATMPPTGSVTLMWNPSPSPDIAGYNVLYGTASGDYTSEVLVGNTNVVTISNLEPGITYYFAVTCYNLAGEESAPSNEATYTVPADLTSQPVVLGNAALASKGFSFTVTDEAGTNFVVEASVDLVNWIPVSTNTAPFTFVDTDASQFSQRFYRTVIVTAVAPSDPTQPTDGAPFDPISQPVVLGNAALASNGFSFTVTDEAGTNFVVEASVDLVNWIPVSTNTAPFTFVDTDASQFSQRFYRTVALP